MNLNGEQRGILTELRFMRVAPEDAMLSTRRLAQLRRCNYDPTHSRLVRMEKRGLVERIEGRPAQWRLTDKGRAEL